MINSDDKSHLAQRHAAEPRVLDPAALPPPVPPAHAPDWSTLETDLHCPRCDYNLRMLTLPRCPECGLEFDWQELIAATTRERACPIFEYQWRRRPVRSFLYTVWLAILPWRLWRTIKLEFEPRLGPLLLLAALIWVGTYVLRAAMRGGWILWAYYPTGSAVEFWSEFRGHFDQQWLRLAAQTQVAPLVIVLASIAVYRITLLRFRIRIVHLIRIAVLSWLAWFVSAIAIDLVAYTVALALFRTNLTSKPVLPEWTYGVSPFTALALYVASLTLAFRHYLRLPRAWLAAALSMTLATVAIAVITVAYYVYTPRRTFGSNLAPLDAWIPGLQWFCLRVLSSG